jgi:hypothetical protein
MAIQENLQTELPDPPRRAQYNGHNFCDRKIHV